MFQFYDFKFEGLLQKYEERKDASGNPLWDVVLVDPREILEGAQVLIGGYSGSVGAVPNLFNAFGWWENAAGFGGSLANEAGMPWLRIRDAVLTLANSPSPTTYGGPLKFRGVQYGLDLSQLPSPPLYYRIGGVAVSLLEAIAQICEDGGCDFFVELVGYTIKIRTISRLRQPPLGTISALANANLGGTLVRSSAGLECRNETTSSFLVGGEVTTLHLTDALTQFWGYDVSGNVITGSTVFLWKPRWTHLVLAVPRTVPSTILSATQPPDQSHWTFEAVDDIFEVMNLNASPVSDIVGRLFYTCSTLEMRMARVNVESWMFYMEQHRADVARLVGITSPFLNMNGPQQLGLRNNLVNDGNARAQAENAVASDIWIRVMRLYEFVKGYADEYMGRRFVCGVPFLLRKIDSETLSVHNSYDVTDGGYLPEEASPLGLSTFNADLFKIQDGRYRAFVEFSDLSGIDLSHVSPQNSVIEDGIL